MKRMFISLAFFVLCVAKISAQTESRKSTSTIAYTISAEDSTQVFAVLDSFILNFRQPLQQYIQRHLQTYLFPHVRIASGKVLIANSPDSIGAAYWLARMPADWDHSAWLSRQIVQASPLKVHMAVVFRRLRKDNTIIADEPSLYILEKVNGKWGVRARSSYAQ